MITALISEEIERTLRMLKSVHRGVVREFNPDRKETHWVKRKLKGDE